MKRCLAGSLVFLAAAALWLSNGQERFPSSDGTPEVPPSTIDAKNFSAISSADDARSQQTNGGTGAQGPIGKGTDGLAPTAHSSNSLVIRIRGLRPDRSIHVALFDQPGGFPARRDAICVMSAKSSDISEEVVIDGLMAGTYAIAVFQDLNEDGILNKGVFGVPSEPYGFSNNARGKFGPPSFQAAAFRCSQENGVMEIALR